MISPRLISLGLKKEKLAGKASFSILFSVSISRILYQSCPPKVVARLSILRSSVRREVVLPFYAQGFEGRSIFQLPAAGKIGDSYLSRSIVANTLERFRLATSHEGLATRIRSCTQVRILPFQQNFQFCCPS